MKIGIYGNCQSNGFADSIYSFLDNIEIHLYRLNDAIKASKDELRRQFEGFKDCDIIFYQPTLGTQIEPFDEQGFSSVCDKLIPYPHIAFRSLQPDCHHIKHDGSWLKGPMGPYHSAIIAAGYLEGLSPHRVERLFNSYTYHKLEYLGRKLSNEVLAKDAKALGYNFDDFMLGKRGKFMNTVNHPAINIIFSSAEQALVKAGLKLSKEGCQPPDRLAKFYVWPVYTEISDQFGIIDPMIFSAPKGVNMSLKDMISSSFDVYSSLASPLNTAQINDARNFIRSDIY